MAELSLASVVEHGASILSLPKHALRVFQLAVDADSSNEEIVRAISLDPLFAARLLQKVNSPAFARGAQITSLDVAVARLGREQLAQLAAVLATVEEVYKLESDLLTISDYWQHSLRVGLIASKIAERNQLDAESCFIAGLLHDLGKPVEFHMLGDQMMTVLEQSLMEDDPDISSAERDVLGFNHGEVGADLAKCWGLPELYVECMLHHHDPGDAPNYPREAAVIGLSNAIEHMELDGDFEDLDAFHAMANQTKGLISISLEEALVLRLNVLVLADKLAS